MASVSTKQHQDYDYTKLKDLRVGSKFNVFGIVKNIIKINAETRTGKFHSVFLIIDESLAATTTFRMHVYSSIKLPSVNEGMILRFHRVKVESYLGVLDGRVFQGRDIVFFSPTRSEEFKSLAVSPTITDEDKIRVNELREVVALNALFQEDDKVSEPVSSKTKEMNGGNKVAGAKESTEEIFGTSLYLADDNRVVIGKPDQPHQKLNSEETSVRSIETAQEQGSNPSKKHSKVNGLISNCDGDCNESGSESSDSNEEEDCEINGVVFLPNPFNARFKFHGENTQQQIDSFVERSFPKSISRGSKRSEAALGRKALNPEDKSNAKKIRLHDTAFEPEVEPLQPLSSKPSCDAKGRTAGAIPTASTTPQVDTPSKKNPVEENLSAAASLAPSTRSKSVDSLDSVNNTETPVKDVCPGTACAMDCSQQGPVVLDDDDPRLEGFDEEKLVFEGEGDIPACDEEGCNIGQAVTSRDGKNCIISDSRELLPFQWPEFRSKVRIVAVKPGLRVLKTSGPRNLLSGTCDRCKTHTFYSGLQWETDFQNRTKRPLCPFSIQDGQKDYVRLDFRFKLIVRDAWGTQLSLYGVKSGAINFLARLFSKGLSGGCFMSPKSDVITV